MQPNVLIMAGAVMLFTAIALVFDLRTRKIPNWLTVTFLGMALAFHVFTTQWSGLGTALAGFGVGFGILFVLWLIGGGGGGDVKLMGALGAWIGPWLTMIVFVVSGGLALLGLVLVFVWRKLSRATRPAYAGSAAYADGRALAEAEAARRMIPYAVPVTIAAWSVMLLKVAAACGAVVN